MPRRRDFVAWLLVGGVGVALLINEGLRQLSARTTAPFDPADLASLSRPDSFELILLGLLAATRLIATRVLGRRLLLPLVDLPLLGLVVAVSGGTLSPLDPTLALVYLSALLFLRGSEAGRTTSWRIAIELLLGLAAVHALVLRHDGLRLSRGTNEETQRVAELIDAARRENGEALRTIADGLAELPAPDAVAKSALGANLGTAAEPLYVEMAGELRSGQDAIARFLAVLQPTTSTEDLGGAKQALDEELAKQHDRYFEARMHWTPAPAAATATGAFESLDRLRETQWNVRQDLMARMDDVEEALVRRDGMFDRQAEFLRDATFRRIALAASLVLFALVAIALRDRLAAAVRESEERRARRDVEASQQETEHWIAVTAGLTHGLGNDILAYDVWLREIERELAGASAIPAKVLERLRFLVDSNRGRLGFLRFLDAFARQRRSAAGEAPPPPTEPVALVPLLERVRRNLAQVEIADLPPEGTDPAADRQIHRLRDLPLQIRRDDPTAGELRNAQRGLVEFVAYELLKNALRSATGERPLQASLTRRGTNVELALENDVQVDAATGACSRCGRVGELRRVRRRRDAGPTCDACFGPALQRLLEESFAPGKGSGTGLGLFLIRYFLATFWHAEVRASVVDAAIPVVRFAVDLPDQLPQGTR